MNAIAPGLLLAALLLAGCTRTPPEQAVRAAVEETAAAIEARDAGALQRRLAEDFIGPDGMDRDGARRMAALYLMQHTAVGVTLGPLEVALHDNDERATVRFSAARSGGSGRFVPDTAQVYQVETGWRLRGGEWRMTSATWTPAALP